HEEMVQGAGCLLRPRPQQPGDRRASRPGRSRGHAPRRLDRALRRPARDAAGTPRSRAPRASRPGLLPGGERSGQRRGGVAAGRAAGARAARPGERLERLGRVA
ncbi:MAG: hypothetical protein ACK55Z_18145, partial [bacterium]